MPPSMGMQQAPHLGTPARGAPQRFHPQQPPYLPPPSGSYMPYQPDRYQPNPYQQPLWQQYPQHMSPYGPQVGASGFPAPPPMYPLQPLAPHPHAFAPAAPPHVDAMAVQAHLAMLQQQQHALTAHLAALQLASPAPPPASVHGAGGPAQMGPRGDGGTSGQGLVYPIGGPREAFEDARE